MDEGKKGQVSVGIDRGTLLLSPLLYHPPKKRKGSPVDIARDRRLFPERKCLG